MTNENNNINELVANDDDPTVALEAPVFVQDQSVAIESDAKTYDSEQAAEERSTSGITVSELRSDLSSRKKTISHLQYDIQQLHTKWLGLETEINAREAQTEQLGNELLSSREAVARKERLLKRRDQKIKALKTEIRQRDDNYRQLTRRIEEMQVSATEVSPLASDGGRPIDDTQQGDLQQQLNRTEEYADSLRQQSQDLIRSNARAERDIESLSQRLDDALQKNLQLSDGLTLSEAAQEKLQTSLSDMQSRHDDEIRLLRFDLGAAQDTFVESEELNSQLASELIDACGLKDELERMLGDAEAQSSERIEELQKEVSKLHRNADTYKQKLTTKSEAISVLLAELAKKAEQIDSIGKIEEVIQDIDDRMSERSNSKDLPEQRAPTDRISRVLIGSVDDQLLRFPLFKDRLTIGRTKDNDIQLKAEYVSRRHAVIQTDGETTRIIDWGSKNGIHVNSVKVSEHFLCHGDTISIGSARFRYEERKRRD
jgi:chromosome segregation ATPase